MIGPVTGEDGLARCPWAAGDPVTRAYHDDEWGLPVRGERGLFERLSLEAFESGLSWRTILNKRPGSARPSMTSMPTRWPGSATPTSRA